jgi:hypothetical protein
VLEKSWCATAGSIFARYAQGSGEADFMLIKTGRLTFIFFIMLISLNLSGLRVQAEVARIPTDNYTKSVTWNTIITSKTIEALKENINSIDFEITGDHGYRLRTTIGFCDENKETIFNDLIPGTYTIKSKARDKSNKILFQGENRVKVVEGVSTSLVLNMDVEKTYPAEFKIANVLGNYSEGKHYFTMISFDDNTRYYASAVYRGGTIYFSIDWLLINKKGMATISIVDNDAVTHFSNMMVDTIEMIKTGDGSSLSNEEGTGGINTALVFSRRKERKKDIFQEDKSLKTDLIQNNAGLEAQVKRSFPGGSYYLYIDNGEAYRYISLGSDTLLRLKLIEGDINQGLFFGLESADKASFKTWANVNLFRYNATEIISKSEVYSFQNFHDSRCEIDVQKVDKYILLVSKVKLFYGANKFIDIILFDDYGNRILKNKISKNTFRHMDTLLPDLIVTDVDDIANIQELYENISSRVTSRIADNKLIIKFETREGKVFTFDLKINE